MRIESMTATFGKLEHQTLTLEPGLNVITAGNEWGKSTWCDFLLAMLYGLDTRAKSTKTALSPKEHYAPWSGSPMAGRMTLLWQGRRITLERRTTGRVPMGDFRVYETESGLAVPELTAENCGRVLLGVEREVFCRAGFIRQEDMPVTQSEALRARLNALVTTGDDSGEQAQLAQKLKELKNKCRYNQSGLLPQAQAQLRDLDDKLAALTDLEGQLRSLEQQKAQTEQYLVALQNHRAALQHAKAEADAQLLAKARQEAGRAARDLENQQTICDQLPTRQEAQQRLKDLTECESDRQAAEATVSRLSQLPEKPETPPVFRGLTGEAALEKVHRDGRAYRAIVGVGFWSCVVLAALALAAGLTLLLGFGLLIPALVGFGASALLLGLALIVGSREKEKQKAMAIPYGGGTPEQWEEMAKAYAEAQQRYLQENQAREQERAAAEQRLWDLEAQQETLCEGRTRAEMEDLCRQVFASWDRLEALRQQKELTQRHAEAMSAMAVQAPAAAFDELTLSPEETAREQRGAEARLAELHGLLGATESQLTALGTRQALEQARQTAGERAARLEEYYAALTIAQDTLAEAAQNLQRRFAPQIAAGAQAYLKELTSGRYDRLVLTVQLELLAGTQTEETLRAPIWRSSGTTDQLYLALRLAVAQALTKEAPLILDDAFVRFDDERLEKAVALLRRLGEEKQILLFSCQRREAELVTKDAPEGSGGEAGSPSGACAVREPVESVAQGGTCDIQQ